MTPFWRKKPYKTLQKMKDFGPKRGPQGVPNVVYLRAENLAGRPESHDVVYLRAGLRPAGGRRIFFIFPIIITGRDFFFREHACLPAVGGVPPQW